MKTLFLLPAFFIAIVANAQNVGIGTTTPDVSALLHVDVTNNPSKGLIVSGIYDATYTFSSLGMGSKLMFFPGRAAFRAGFVDGAQWDNAYVGQASCALGFNTQAMGNFSTALGFGTIASGQFSTSIGNNTLANSSSAIAMGANTQAKAASATAMGLNTIASGIASTALGNLTIASGNTSTAMGNNTTASGALSTALGNTTTASGNNSSAIGNYVSTSGFDGAFAIGDNSTTTVMQSFVDNGFRSRFAGGYRLLSNSTASIGVVLLPNGNSWGTISDVRLKEKFLPVNGENFLKKIAQLNLTTWNYKTQDPATLRHYGPMAQDFFAAFGKDEFGTIGCDTLINQQDFLGVNLIAIQALEKRTAELKNENEKLKQQLTEQAKENMQLKKSIALIESTFQEQQQTIIEQQKTIDKILKRLTALEAK